MLAQCDLYLDPIPWVYICEEPPAVLLVIGSKYEPRNRNGWPEACESGECEHLLTETNFARVF